MYNPYQGINWQIRKATKIHKAIRNRGIEENLLDSAEISCGMQGELTQDGLLMILEMSHYLLSHQVFCVSAGLAQRLLETKIEIPPENLHIPFRLFEVCFEDSFELKEGVKAPSCLIMYRPDEAQRSTMTAFLQKIAKRLADKLNYLRAEKGLPPGPIPEPLVDQSVTELYSCRYRSSTDDSICHATINLEKSKGKSIDDVIDNMGVLPGSTVMELSKEDLDVQKRLSKIVFGLLCYLNTDDPDVSVFKDKNRPKLGCGVNSVVVGKDFQASPGWHLRSAHWRVLEHERFKRDPNGKIRCVWVRSAEVGKGQEAAQVPAKVIELGGDENVHVE